MNELLKIETNNDSITVNARDLHQFIESNERFSKWFSRMSSYGLVEGVDFNPYQKVQAQLEGGRIVVRNIKDFELTIDAAREISMLQRNEKVSKHVDTLLKLRSPGTAQKRLWLERYKYQIEKLNH